MNPSEKNTHYIKSAAASLGFDFCGIARAEKLNEDARRLEAWLKAGMHGSMQYMEKYFDMRINPLLLVPGAKSVITLLLNYFPEEKQHENTPKISKYAWGKDYHQVIKENGLTIPHPEMSKRRFVLEPLNEVIPAYIHPVYYKTIKELLHQCDDTLPVKKITCTIIL